MDMKSFDTRFRIIRIKKIIRENDVTNTYIFDYPLFAKPGQFVMVWIPGVDEKPMSVAFSDGREFWITVCKVGGFSSSMHELKVGDKIGIRGPFGTHYEIGNGQKIVLVAGGYGVAPMYFAAHEAVSAGCNVDFLMGARNKDLLIYTHKILGLGVNLQIATDDGSVGVKGYITKILEEVLGKSKVDKVFTCGPEVMMKAVGEISFAKKVSCYISVEKYMKCGIGVCGQCAIDDTGDLVCKKGPVMSWDYLRKLPEVGQYHRDAQGKKQYFFKKTI